MARLLAEGEALEQVGVMGLRGPNGDIVENVELYRIVPAAAVNPESGLTRDEEQPCERVGTELAKMMHQYIKGTSALKRAKLN